MKNIKIPFLKRRWGFLLIKTGRFFIYLKTGRKGGPVLKRTAIFAIAIFLFFIIAGVSNFGAAERGLKSVAIETTQGERIELYKDSYALVIGNSNYTHGWDLIPGAIRDVNEVATALEKHGFAVTLKTDLTKEKFSRALNEFSIKYGRDKDNRLLFYYAGHGFTQQMATGEELGYLVMVNAPLPEADLIGFSLSSVDMQSVITQAKIIRARHVLFMFDSCFSGSIISMRERVIPKSISDSVKYPVRQFITAGRANEPVPDQSVFKQAFLDLLAGRDAEPIPDHYITGEELGLYLKTKVPQYNPSQHPQYGKIKDPRLDKGDFVFALKRPQSIRPPEPQPPELEAEKKRLADETAQIERERQELAQLKLELEKQKLEAERRQLEMEEKRKENQKLAAISKEVTIEKVSLRKEPGIISKKDIFYVLYRNGFFDKEQNPLGKFANDFIVNPDETITDGATDLMWQKSGSRQSLTRNQATSYVKKLNKERFAGYADWRLPTIEELASLLKRVNKGLYISSVFDSKQKKCWSADSLPLDKLDPGIFERPVFIDKKSHLHFRSGSTATDAAIQLDWIINFLSGYIDYARWIRKGEASDTDSAIKDNYNHVRAVRSLK